MEFAFAQIIGQTRATDQLAHAIDLDRVAQAYLFVGPPGIGKRTTAIRFGAALASKNVVDIDEKQRILERVQSGNHPDIVMIAPDGNSIKIEQIRQLATLTAFPPIESARRIIVIDGGELLTANAANALLKNIEEPPTATTFVIIAITQAKLLPTIVSRCQRIVFTPLDDPSIRVVLTQIGVTAAADPDSIASAIRYAGGSVSRAISCLESDSLPSNIETVTRIVTGIGRNDVTTLLQIASDLGKDRPALLKFLEILRVHWHHLLLSSVDSRSSSTKSHDGDANRRDSAASLENTTQKLCADLRAIDDAEQQLLRNLNSTLVLERLLLSLAGSIG